MLPHRVHITSPLFSRSNFSSSLGHHSEFRYKWTLGVDVSHQSFQQISTGCMCTPRFCQPMKALIGDQPRDPAFFRHIVLLLLFAKIDLQSLPHLWHNEVDDLLFSYEHGIFQAEVSKLELLDTKITKLCRFLHQAREQYQCTAVLRPKPLVISQDFTKICPPFVLTNFIKARKAIIIQIASIWKWAPALPSDFVDRLFIWFIILNRHCYMKPTLPSWDGSWGFVGIYCL